MLSGKNLINAAAKTALSARMLCSGLCSAAVQQQNIGLTKLCLGGCLQVIFHVTIQNKSLEFPPTVPEELSSIGAQCMSKDPVNRPTMKEVVAALEKLAVAD